MGTTVLVASMRDDGQTFQERRTPRLRKLALTMPTTTTRYTDRLCPQRLRNLAWCRGVPSYLLLADTYVS